METLDGTSWDVVIAGTGIQQSLLALYASRHLHIIGAVLTDAALEEHSLDPTRKSSMSTKTTSTVARKLPLAFKKLKHG